MNTSNRRIEGRQEIRIPSVLENNGIQSKILLVDVSDHGIGFITSNNLVVGQTVQVTFNHDGIKLISPISLKLKIQNCQPHSHSNRFGGMIIEMNDDYQTMTKQFSQPITRSKFANKMHHLLN